MSEVSTLRLYLLRGMYLLIAVGLGITVWPSIVLPHDTVANEGTVISALLCALVVASTLRLRYPLRMLPILLFELLWKLIWVFAFALRMWLTTGLDEYASQTLFACLIGVVPVPMVMSWGYVFRHYVCATGEPWRKSTTTRTG